MTKPLVVSRDPDLVEEVLRLAAVHGIDLQVFEDAGAAGPRWASAPLVVIGADMAGDAALLQLPRRRGLVIAALGDDGPAWSTATDVGAEHVVRLPQGERWLIDRLVDDGARPRQEIGVVVAVTSCVGGAGATTLAATLSLLAAERGMGVTLIDGDPRGGGLDVALGAEESAGARWSEFASVRGRLAPAALEQALPRVHGVRLLSADRQSEGLPTNACATVIAAAERCSDLVVVDLPREGDLLPSVLPLCAHAVLVTTNHVRAAAAASAAARWIGSQCADVQLVLRHDPRGIAADAVADALAPRAVVRVPHSSSLPKRADAGEPPSVRDAYAKACAGLLSSLLGGRAGRAA